MGLRQTSTLSEIHSASFPSGSASTAPRCALLILAASMYPNIRQYPRRTSSLTNVPSVQSRDFTGHSSPVRHQTVRLKQSKGKMAAGLFHTAYIDHDWVSGSLHHQPGGFVGLPCFSCLISSFQTRFPARLPVARWLTLRAVSLPRASCPLAASSFPVNRSRVA